MKVISMAWKKEMTPMAVAALAGRILLGAVFIYASWDKIRDPAAFSQSIANYQILPMQWVNAAALYLPWLELICGLALIFGLAVRGSALIVGVLNIIFIGAMAYSIVRGLDIHCGCFTAGEGMPSSLYVDIFRDFVLLAITILVLYRYGPADGIRRTGEPS